MSLPRVLASLSVLAVPAIGTSAFAASVVAPDAYAGTAGYEYQTSILGNGSTQTVSFQEGFDAPQFAALPAGASITGIGYRLASNLPTISDAISYSDFTITVGGPAVPIGNLSTDKTANLGANTATVRTGAFTLPGGALTNNGGLNPFYTIAFATPYRYTVGDLLVTTSYTAQGNVPFVGLDSVDPVGVVNTVGGNDPAFLRTHTFNAPVAQFTFAVAAAPEPGTWLLMVVGCGLAGWSLRRRGMMARARAV